MWPKQLHCELPDFLNNNITVSPKPTFHSVYNSSLTLFTLPPSCFPFLLPSCPLPSLPNPAPLSFPLRWLTRCFSSFSLKPVRSSCCGRGRGRGGSGVKLFPPRARRHACSLDEQAAAWSQSSQVSALRGEQLCGAHDAAKWFGGSSGPWGAYVYQEKEEERWRKIRAGANSCGVSKPAVNVCIYWFLRFVICHLFSFWLTSFYKAWSTMNALWSFLTDHHLIFRTSRDAQSAVVVHADWTLSVTFSCVCVCVCVFCSLVITCVFAGD